ncbi:MAG: tetratricopeptide repeat protein [bacterium]
MLSARRLSFESLIHIGLITLIILHTLVVSPYTFRSTELKTPIDQILILVLSLLYGGWRTRFVGTRDGGIKNPKSRVPTKWVRNPKLFLPLGIFLLLACFSTALSPYKLASLYEFANLISYALLFWIILVSVKDSQTIHLLLNVLLGVSLLVSLYGLAQYFGYDIFTGGGGVTSTFGNSNFLAGFLVVVIPLAITFSFRISHPLRGYPEFRNKGPEVRKGVNPPSPLPTKWGRHLPSVGYGILSLCLILCLGLTQTRGAWIAFGVEIILLIVIFSIRNPRSVIAVGLVLLFLSIGLLLLVQPATIQRVTSIFEPAGFDLTPSPEGVKSSIQVRLFIWQGTLRMFAAAPILGHGLGTFMINFPQFRPAGFHSGGLGHNTHHAHSEYMEILAEMGILGLLAFLWFIFTCLWIGVKKWGMLSGCLVSIIGLLVHSAFTVDLRFTSGVYLWLLLGLVVVMARPAEKLAPKVISPSKKRRPSKLDEPQAGAPNSKLIVAYSLLAIGLLILLIPFIIRPAQASLHLKRGDIAEKRGDYTTAIREYEQAISISPICYPAYYQAGYLYVEKIPDTKEALSTYQKLIKYAPNYAQVHYNQGLLHRKMGDLPLARAELQQCLKNNPYHKGSHFNLGLTWLDLGELREAEAEFKTTLELDPQDAASRERLVSIYFQQKRWDEAIAQSEALIQIQPENAAAHSNLGAVYSEKGDKGKAYYYLKKAVEVDPKFLVGYQNLWFFLNKEGRREEAAIEYQKMLKLKTSVIGDQ